MIRNQHCVTTEVYVEIAAAALSRGWKMRSHRFKCIQCQYLAPRADGESLSIHLDLF